MCLFCDFISGEAENHMNGFPFIKILEDNNLLVFLGAPEIHAASTESDVLVIPKQHFEFIEDVPKEILTDLINQSIEIVRILKEKYGSSKIFLNNGKFANQYIPHVHFHISPINEEKKHVFQNLTLDEFKEISSKIKALSTFKNH